MTQVTVGVAPPGGRLGRALFGSVHAFCVLLRPGFSVLHSPSVSQK